MSNLRVFAESSTNLLTDNQYNASTERTSGFIAGTKINSNITNTALREASLVSVALADALNLNVGVDTTLANATSEISNKLPNISVGEASANGQNIIYSKGGTTSTSVIQPTFNGTTFALLPTENLDNYFKSGHTYQFYVEIPMTLFHGTPSSVNTKYILSFAPGYAVAKEYETEIFSSVFSMINGVINCAEIRFVWSSYGAGMIHIGGVYLYVNEVNVTTETGVSIYYKEVY